MAPRYVTILVFFSLLILPVSGSAAASAVYHHPVEDVSSPLLIPASLSELAAEYVAGRTADAAEAGQEADHSLFENTPLGWDLSTIRFLYNWVISLPLKVPGFMQYVMEEGRLFGALGSIILIVFAVAVFYSMIGQKRVLAKIEKELQPLWDRVHALARPHFLSFIKIVLSALPPLVLLGIFMLITGLIHEEVSWFLLTKKLLGLWAAGALAMNFLRETMIEGLLPFCPRYGKRLFQSLRLVLIYIATGITLVWGAEAISLPDDVIAFIRFAISLTVVFILSSLFLQKDTLVSLLPRLPYRSYTAFTKFIDKAYFPLVLLTFFAGLLWCVGYQRLAVSILSKTWGVATAYVMIMISYHFLLLQLQRRSESTELRKDEAAQFFFRSARAFLRYGTIALAALIILDLLGLLAPLRYVMSFPVFTLGDTPFSVLVMIEAGLTLFAFICASRLLQTYLDYKIYPSTGIDTGLGYALNTFLKYLFIGIGFITSLRVLGLDPRVLMVFAGGVGIGAGVGLQNITANIISGFIIIFGRKIRKGDWIKVGDRLGMVTHIYLRATKIWTRDNIEYIVPNTDFISKPIINYTLTSPIVRIYIPVGVSYNTPPSEVQKILLEAVEKHPMITQFRKPEIRIAEFGDSSVKFEVLIWIDIRQIAEKDIRSQLYFAIFDALDKAGMEIPFPQRDIHIRTGAFPQMDLCTGDQKDSELCRTVS